MEIQEIKGAILEAPSVAFAQAAKADNAIVLSIDEAIDRARLARSVMFEAVKASLNLALQGSPREWENLVRNGFAVANQGTVKTLLSAKTADGFSLKSILSSAKTGYRVKSSIFTESVKIDGAKDLINNLLNPFEVRVKRTSKGEIEKMLGDLNRASNRLKVISPADNLMADNLKRYIDFYESMLAEEKDLGNA